MAPGWRNPSNRSFSLKLCCTLPSISHKAATSVQCLQTYAASCPVCEAFAVVLCLRFASSVVLFFLFCALGVGPGLCAVLRMLHQEVVDEHGSNSWAPLNSNSKSKISNFCIVSIFQFLQAGCVYFSEPKNDHHAGLLLTCYYLAYSESFWVNMIQ